MSDSDRLTPPLEALYWSQYGTWYPIFRKHAPKSTVIDIDGVQPELLSWLDSDTFVLPDGSGPSTLPQTNNSSSELSDDENEKEEQEPVMLDKLDTKIRQVVDKYDGGPLFPKLNWSAPLDAGFMLPGNNLQCFYPEDVYLLLKSSEFVGRDLEQIASLHTPSLPVSSTEHDSDPALQLPTSTTASPQSQPSQEREVRPQLILKKWFTFARSHEFRCFVRSSHLIAISQRDVTFYDHLQSPHLQAQIKGAIWDFWQDVMAPAQKEGSFPLKDFIFDVYLTKDLERVWLVDVNAWLPRTDPLLWSFDDLEGAHLREKKMRRSDGGGAEEEGLEDGIVQLRIAPTNGNSTAAVDSTEGEDGEGYTEEWSESDVELRVLSDRRMQSSGGTSATYSSNMVPKDLVDFAKTNGSSSGGGMGIDQIVQRWNESIDAEEDSKQA